MFTHASTSPNQQLIASLDVARRQMELEGYGLVDQCDRDRARDPRRGQQTIRCISKYFRVLGADEMVPAQYRQSGFNDYLATGVNWANALRACTTTNSASTRPA